MATVNIPEQYQTLKTRLENVIKKVIEPQYIPNGSNLNDYTDVGMYYNGANAETTNITNLPNNTHSAFCLFVEEMGGNARKQTLTFQLDINSMFVRVKKCDNTWTTWKPVWEDTGWTDLSLKSGFSHYTTDQQRAQYRRVGKIVQIRGALKNTNAFTPNNTVMATIGNTSCRPHKETYSVCQGSSMNRWLMKVNANGEILIERYGTTSASQVVSGAWLVLNMTYIVA